MDNVGADTRFSYKQVITIAVVSLMLLMEMIDGSILNVAIPNMSLNLNIPALHLKLAVTSYLISLAIFIPISGWMSDRFGTRNILLFAVALFGISSFLCGVANSLVELIVFRFLQGIAGAFMTPVGRLLLLKVFGKSGMVRAYTLSVIPVILGPLLAPLMGGVLVEFLSWRYIFFVNIPFVIVAFVVAYKYIDDYRQDVGEFNWWSFIWLGIFLSSFSYWLDILFYPLSTSDKVELFIVALISFCLYLKVEFSSSNKIVDYSLFKIKTFRLCFFSGLFTRISLGGRGFAAALFLQITLKMSPIESGVLLASMAIGLLLGRLFMGRYLNHFGFKRMMMVGNIGATITSVALGFITHADIFAVIVLVMGGFFTTFVFMLLNLLSYADVPESQYSAATGIVTTTQQLCMSFGVVLMAAFLQLYNGFFGEFSQLTFQMTFISVGILNLLAQYCLRQLSDEDGANLLKKRQSA